jgi:EAL domain-containing protein (putative c-di-GMP-specific phosphodiesterase class I)
VAEESALIDKISEWAIEEACRQIREWQDNGHANFVTAVNITGRQFMNNRLPKVIREQLKRYNLSPKQLGIEITESILVQEGELADEVLHELADIGVNLNIDDFGVGYSSLSYLRRMPVQKLKVDKSFIEDVPHDEDAVAIVRAIVSMAQQLHLKTVVEGVENKIQADFLKEMGVDVIQGYYFSKPIPAPQVIEYIQKYQPYLG